MVAIRRRLEALGESELMLVAATIATAAFTLFSVRRFGTVGLVVPLGIALVVILMRRPVAAVTSTVALAVLCEGSSFGIPVMAKLYKEVYKGFTPLDGLVLLAVLAVALDVVRSRRPLRMSGALGLPLLFVALAILAGAVTTSASGLSTVKLALMLHVLGYLLVLPAAVVNLDLDQRRLRLLLGGAVALAILKAIVGLVVMASGGSVELDSGTHLTYYEPTANWLIMVALFGIVAALLGGVRVSRWMLLGSPLLVASLVLSYRRSFWIAAVLGLLLLLLFATTRRRRRLLLPVGLSVAVAVWLVGSVQFQAQTPLVQRVQSLAPSKLQTTAEDRYRLDERANVVAEIRRHPVQGIGLDTPWAASARPLPVEHVDGRMYVHFALLWWWLKLGVLGAVAYAAVIASALLLAWLTWRRNASALFSSFGLASFCATAGLIAIETTASFTGVDPRFTVLFGAQLGLLAVLATPSASPPHAPALAGLVG